MHESILIWKDRQIKYLDKKCIDVVKKLRPRIGFFFEIQYNQKKIIQNEFI
jgi:hypothetical protein